MQYENSILSFSFGNQVKDITNLTDLRISQRQDEHAQTMQCMYIPS